jgi:hypothetical protein
MGVGAGKSGPYKTSRTGDKIDKMVLSSRIFILWPAIFILRGADLKSAPPDGAAAAQNEIAGPHFHFVARRGRFVGRCFPARGRRMLAVSLKRKMGVLV